MDRLRVLIAEDHDDLRGIVVAVLSSEFEVIGAVVDGEKLVQAAISLKPDVIVTDIVMPLMDGFSARNELRAKGINHPFVFMTMIDIDEILSSLVDGAVGYVHKMDLFQELKTAIHEVALGGSYISQSFRERLGGP